jgi:hypothetical protein
MILPDLKNNPFPQSQSENRHIYKIVKQAICFVKHEFKIKTTRETGGLLRPYKGQLPVVAP